MTDEHIPADVVRRTMDEVATATTERMLDEGIVVYWQHDVASTNHQGVPWAYTVGRALFGRPELLVTGLDETTSGELLRELDAIEDLTPDEPVVTTAVGRVAFVRAEIGFLHAAYAVFGLNFTALQVIHDRDPQPLHTLGGLTASDPYDEI